MDEVLQKVGQKGKGGKRNGEGCTQCEEDSGWCVCSNVMLYGTAAGRVSR